MLPTPHTICARAADSGLRFAKCGACCQTVTLDRFSPKGETATHRVGAVAAGCKLMEDERQGAGNDAAVHITALLWKDSDSVAGFATRHQDASNTSALPLGTTSHCERLARASLAIRKHCAIDAVQCREND